jgi:DNA polymerase-3 subunit gamma/tau
MLTREAFNALLKTLEEPPPHVVFVMATTEPFKVPATILSRCQRFDFARIHPREVTDRLAAIVEAEGFAVQRDALALLARRSQGGLRDALSALDQVLASADGPVTVEMVNTALGLLSTEFYFQLTDLLIAGDAPGALRFLDEIYHAGADLGELVEELARHLRNIMLLSVGPDLEPVLAELGPAEVARVREQAARVSPVAAARLLEVALRTIGQARRSEHIRLHLEMAMVELASVSGAVSLGEVARRLEEMEQRLGAGGVAGAGDARSAGGRRPAAQRSGPVAPESGVAPEAGSPGPAPPPGDETPGASWDGVVAEVKKRRMAVGAFLMGSRAGGFDEEGRLIVQLDAGHPFHKTHLEEDENRRFIEGVIREVFGRSVKYRVIVGGGGPAAAPRADAAVAPPVDDAPIPPGEDVSAAGTPGDAPAAGPRARKSAMEIAQTDPAVQRVIDLFDGEVTP